jgi:WD40 repeat protein
LLRHFDGGQAFSPDGQTILGISGSAVGQNSAVLIDLKTGQLIRHFNDLAGTPISSPFLPDGHSALVAFSDGKIEQWRIDSLDELIAWTYANRYIPELTCEHRQLYHLAATCDANSTSLTSSP